MFVAPLFFGPFLFMENYRKIWENANGAIPNVLIAVKKVE
jgi:hypothetical protein